LNSILRHKQEIVLGCKISHYCQGHNGEYCTIGN
jgi:hypothetical protein